MRKMNTAGWLDIRKGQTPRATYVIVVAWLIAEASEGRSSRQTLTLQLESEGVTPIKLAESVIRCR